MTPEIVRAIARSEVFRGLQPVEYLVNTTDATATLIVSIDTLTYERGIVEYILNGIKDDGLTGISVKKILSYKTSDTTLTINSATAIYSQSDFSTAAVAENVNGFAIEIKVTGEAATNITWSCSYEQRKLNVEAGT
jgi:hypothetical protein